MEKVSRKDLQAKAEKLGLKFNTKTTIAEFELMIKKEERSIDRKAKVEEKKADEAKAAEEADKEKPVKSKSVKRREAEQKDESSKESSDEDSEESEPEVAPSFIFEGEECEKSAELLLWEERNKLEVYEVFSHGENATHRHCEVYDGRANRMTMHVPQECLIIFQAPTRARKNKLYERY